MQQLATGVVYSEELNKIVYSNEYIINSGVNLKKVSEILGYYSEYISDDDRDILYARVNDIPVFREDVKSFDYSLAGFVDLDKEIEYLKNKHPEFANIIQEEYEYVSQNEHNLLLLRIAFLLKKHLDNTSNGVYLMRGSGVASYLFYVIGLNKVNPYKFGLDYMDFWNN